MSRNVPRIGKFPVIISWLFSFELHKVWVHDIALGVKIYSTILFRNMKFVVIAFLSCIWTTSALENMDERKEHSKSNFRIWKTENRTMVYYFYYHNNPTCEEESNLVIGSEENMKILNIFKKAYASSAKMDGNKYVIPNAQQNRDYYLCARKNKVVNIRFDIISIETGQICVFSNKYCNTRGGVAIWESNPHWTPIFEGEAEIWTLSRSRPTIELLVVEDENGKFILQLLNKFKYGNRIIWNTNINDIHAEEIQTEVNESNPNRMNSSQLAKFLEYSDFSTSPEDTYTFYILILVAVQVALYVLTRVLSVLVNCFILSKTKIYGECGSCCKSFSENLTNYHLMKYYSASPSVPEISSRPYVPLGGAGKKTTSMHLYDTVNIH
ncbi:hypothetical protein JTB14_019702 [Gonioctena quinquepunctata]|nr:hypothetical protein JTB14_019702 [Gonioctena quinquepunctata]